MRVLVLIMTGIGFTLGLLCGLLLQLPADGLPAHIHVNDNHDNHAANVRVRRSLGLDTIAQDQNSNSPSLEQSNRHHSDSEQKSENSNVNSDSQHIARHKHDSEHTDTNTQSHTQTGHHSGQTETGQQGPESPRRSANKPITSFTLRLKNSGGKFIVDSAVQKHRDGKGSSQSDQKDIRQGESQARTDDSSVNTTLSDIVHGAVWSTKLDESCPRGQDLQDLTSWRQRAAGMAVVRMEEGCGRMQNRMLVFKDGSRACARYRLNTDQIQGEVFSYYLAKRLHLHNLPPALLIPVDSLSPQWRNVHLDMSLAQWADGRAVVLTRWMDNLVPSHIPLELREDDRSLHPTWAVLGNKTVPELCDLLQWSDLIVFDYLTANLDRMVNNMFNRQWNAEMMNNPAHNLERTQGGSLVFLDNESGLFHGYRLLDKYHSYHEALLSALCVFRESTVTAVRELHESRDVGKVLQGMVEEGEAQHKHLPPLPEKNANILQERLARVYQQIDKCRAVYGR